MATIRRITKEEFYSCGAFTNPKLFRRHAGPYWRYYRVLQ
ncbi:hypothetical protein PJWF_00103 [Achromobacter phage JWF]|nr:hypothetical protein AXJ13_gp085 [Achromobacter phage JWF]AJD82996.1 hypothetical protein PJWF_00103 [Achromobacter phage JWF]